MMTKYGHPVEISTVTAIMSDEVSAYAVSMPEDTTPQQPYSAYPFLATQADVQQVKMEIGVLKALLQEVLEELRKGKETS